MNLEVAMDRYLGRRSSAENWRREFEAWCRTAPEIIDLEQRILGAPGGNPVDLHTHRFLVYGLLAKGEQLLLDLAALDAEEGQHLADERTQTEAYLRRLEDALDAYHRPPAVVAPGLAALVGST